MGRGHKLLAEEPDGYMIVVSLWHSGTKIPWILTLASIRNGQFPRGRSGWSGGHGHESRIKSASNWLAWTSEIRLGDAMVSWTRAYG